MTPINLAEIQTAPEPIVRASLVSEPPSAAQAAEASSPPPVLSVKQSWAYRRRVKLTAVVLLATWAAVLMSEPFVNAGSLAAVFADYFGWLLFGAGVALRLWGTTNIGGRKQQTLVNHGPYALCRNPLYVGTFLMMFAEACFLKSLTFVLATVVLFVFYHVAVVPVEERVLRSRFGTAYDDYCDAIPRWWPRRANLFAPPVTVAPNPWNDELRRTLWWLSLPLLGTYTAYLQNHPDWPHWFRLP